MRYVLIGKCGSCGRKNDWNDTECPGCHVKRRPWLPLLAMLAAASVAAGTMAAIS